MDNPTPRDQDRSDPNTSETYGSGGAQGDGAGGTNEEWTQPTDGRESAAVHTIDAPADRPGVPMEAEPTAAPGAHWAEPTRQPGAEHALHRVELERATPVFGTAQPLHGLSGVLRARAYAIPEHFARHWLMLLVADRVDVVEDRVGSAMAAPLERAGMVEGARRLRSNPLPFAAGLAAGAWIVGRVYRRRRMLSR